MALFQWKQPPQTTLRKPPPVFNMFVQKEGGEFFGISAYLPLYFHSPSHDHSCSMTTTALWISQKICRWHFLFHNKRFFIEPKINIPPGTSTRGFHKQKLLYEDEHSTCGRSPGTTRTLLCSRKKVLFTGEVPDLGSPSLNATQWNTFLWNNCPPIEEGAIVIFVKLQNCNFFRFLS